MSATIEWKIATLEYVNDSDQVVTRAHWACSAKETVAETLYVADDIGAVLLDDISADADTFIAYRDLTEAQCLDWAWAKIDKADIETRLQKSIDEQTTPPMKSGIPWE